MLGGSCKKLAVNIFNLYVWYKTVRTSLTYFEHFYFQKRWFVLTVCTGNSAMHLFSDLELSKRGETDCISATEHKIQLLLLFSLSFVLSSFNGRYFKYHIKIFSVGQQLKFSTSEKNWWIFKTYKIQQDISWITNTVIFLLIHVSVAKFSPHFIVWLSIVFQRGFKYTFWDVFVGSGTRGQGV